MKNLPKALQHKLQQRIDANALRKLPVNTRQIDFSSNDYLGFSRSQEIFDAAHQYLIDNDIVNNGSTGSRLITGNHELYKETETFIANFHKSPAALVFNSGYDANVGLFSSLPQKEDIILYDEYIHASIRDGIRLCNAKAYKFKHNDLAVLANLIARYSNSQGEIYVVTESVFSMDGDSPNLEEMVKLCKNHNCLLIVDEAHALGIFGSKGEGLIQHLELEDKVFARVMTFGKGLGCHGAAVLGSPELREYLVNFARSFIYTTALPPHSLATILSAYKSLESNVTAKQLKDNISFFTLKVAEHGLSSLFIYSYSAIHCAVIPGNEKVKEIAAVLQQKGFAVKAILSPTVPQGEERLRFCLHSYNTKEEIEAVLIVLKELI